MFSSSLFHFLLKLTVKFYHPVILIKFDSSGMRMSGRWIGKQLKRDGEGEKCVETPGVSAPDVDTGLS